MMNSETTLTIGFIVLIGGFLFTCINFFISRKKDTKQETTDTLNQFNELKLALSEYNIKSNFKLDQICNTTTETKNDLKAMNDEVKEIKKNQIIHDQQIKAIWKAIDDLKGGLK